ncbi:MAG: 2-aminobenzoate-CoA ligase [Gemmatimonadetes bacterium GWC2_71_10]|nr:MAG: 2-aminobenzoate-CoA ligase [Gemmatimonadetes bacterium GWC2_71_10]
MTAHRDSFARDRLPPPELWPDLVFTRPELRYPAQLNCATELLDGALKRGWGDREAIRFPGGSWTYAELTEKANRIAAVLTAQLRLVPGQRVLLRGPNNPLMAACWFGVLKAGGICVTTMPLLRARELAYMIERAAIELVLCDARFTTEIEQTRQWLPAVPRVVTFGAGGELDALMRGAAATYRDVQTAADDIAIIAFTSGTTGRAKGTTHFHRDILAICDAFPLSCLQASGDDLFCGSPPLAFTFGLGGILLFPLRIGARTLLLETATPPHLIKGIAEFGATVCFTAPTAYRAMLPLIPHHDIRTLRKCVSAGEHLPLATFESWKQATGIAIIDGIGSTEMLHIFISAPEGAIRPGSTGRAVPGYEAKIVDENGRDVPPGTLGRLAVRGPTGCRYLEDSELQRGYVLGGWNLPGDSYVMDADGYFWYQSRTDDMIISSGYNIAAAEIENVMLEHPAVQECGVVGVPDEERGQLIQAFVVLRPGHSGADSLVKELQEFVKAQIAPYKYPRAVTFVAALPRTETGKLQRFKLRQGMA